MNTEDTDILERLKHPEREAGRRKMSRNLYVRNVLNSIFILLALVAMVGVLVADSQGGIPSWCMIVALIAVMIKICESAMRMPTMLHKPRTSRFGAHDNPPDNSLPK